MDIHVMDSNYQVTALLENYDSLIWTERYYEAGDFDLKLPRTKIDLSALKKAKFLRIPASPKLMMVDAIDEKSTVSVSGRSLEYVLGRRVIETAGTTTVNNIPELILQLVLHNIGSFATPEARRIPYFNTELPDIYDYKDPEMGYDPIKFGENLYDAVVKLCIAGDLGFKIINPMEAGYTLFQVYYGTDRTINKDAVIFSEAIGNIEDVTRFKTEDTLKNVAVVNLPPWDDTVGIGEVWRVAQIGTPRGLERREVWTDASELRRDESFTAANKPSRARAWGAIELMGHKATNDIDFKVTSTNPYKFGVDYNLGDLVTVIDSAGEALTHRVTEYIRSFGPEGDAEYPTLSVV